MRRGPIAVNSTFWSLLYGVSKEQPSWVPEVIERWLRRNLFLIHQTDSKGDPIKWGNLLSHDAQAPSCFFDAAKAAPELFVKHVLPLVLEISDLAACKDENSAPRRDDVWGFLFHGDYESTENAILSSLVVAFESLVKISPESLPAIVENLQGRDTFISNYLLLNLLREGAEIFANQAAILLSCQPWRFNCGYSDNRYWVAIQLIQAISPLCSTENLSRLESEILKYSTDYEHSASGLKYSGNACFSLLSAIPLVYRSAVAQTRYLELERKFKQPTRPPRGIHGYTVVSPIKKREQKKCRTSNG